VDAAVTMRTAVEWLEGSCFLNELEALTNSRNALRRAAAPPRKPATCGYGEG
jgi:hypothetical protein